MVESMIIRIDPGLKSKASSLARSEGKSVSQVVRDLLEDYVQDRDLGSYIKDFWKRVRVKLKKRGVKASDVSKAIFSIRTARRKS